MSEFKVGDWVKSTEDPTCILQIKTIEADSVSGTYGASLRGIMLEHTELWTPQPGEWCWSISFGFVKFLKFNEPNEFIIMSYNNKVHNVLSIEPFIGTLPTFLKDN